LNVFSLLRPEIRSVLAQLGLYEPTPVQRKAIPVILNGWHTLIVSPTGTGKTEAAVLPVFSRLLDSGIKPGYVSILYITPLRALNRDILRRIRELALKLGINVAVRHGDTPEAARREMAVKPPSMLITTPETLQFLLVGKRLRQGLRKVRWVIVDELHELIDDKRGVQLAIALERLAKLAGRVQRIGLSATIGDIVTARKMLAGNRMVIDIVADMPRGTSIMVDSPSPEAVNGEKQFLALCSPEAFARVKAVVEHIEKSHSTLVFTNTRDAAELLTARIKAVSGNRVAVHHGSLSKDVRISIEKEFKDGKLKALICTSSMELGIDIGHVDQVIQFMSPRQALRLIQRVGRSGHRLDLMPRGVVIAGEGDDLLESAVLARRALAGEYEKPVFHRNAYDVLAHQIVGMAMEQRGLTVSEIYDTVLKAYPYSDLSRRDLQAVLDFLSEIRIIRVKDGVVRLRKGAFKYYYQAASTIPDTLTFKVIDLASNSYVGELDEVFVSVNCEHGFVFILSGKPWQVVNIDREKRIVNVAPARNLLGAIPAWEGELIPVSYKVAREVGALKRLIKAALESGQDPYKFLRPYPLTQRAKEKIVNYVKQQLDSGKPVPDDKTIVIEEAGKVTVIHAAFGSKVNLALAMLFSHILSKRFSSSVGVRSDPYRILVILPTYADQEIFEYILMKAPMGYLREEMYEAVKRSNMYRWRLLQVAKRFGVVEKDSVVKSVDVLLRALEGTLVAEEAVKEILTEKIDVEKLFHLLAQLRTGKLKLTRVKSSLQTLSPMAKPIVVAYSYLDYTLPPVPIPAILNAVKKRLYEEEVKLVCLHRLDWSATFKVKNLPEKLRCPRCGSVFIAVLPRFNQDEYLRILKKKLRGNRLTVDERKLLQKIQLTAKLAISYGRRAALTLAGRGIGPVTAARILSKTRSEEELIKSIFEAERNYFRTRQFWD